MLKRTLCFTLLSFHLINAHAYKISDYQKLESNNSCEKCDLTEADFPKDISGLSFKNSYLTGSKSYNINASNSDFKNSNFVFSVIDHSNFKGSDFSNTNASFARFSYSTFTNATFENAKMDHSSFTNSNFSSADFSGSNLSKSDFSFTNLYNSNITETQLNTLKSYKCAILPNGEQYDKDGEFNCSSHNHKNDSLSIAPIKHLNNHGAKLRMNSGQDEEYFKINHHCSGCDLSSYTFCPYFNMDFSGSKIIDSDMHSSTISGCKFMSTQILNTFMFSSKISYVHFEESNFESSKMDYIDIDIDSSYFSGSSFKNTNLKKAKFAYTNLSSTDFRNTNLKDASFYKVILIGSNVSEQQLQQALSIKCTVPVICKIVVTLFDKFMRQLAAQLCLFFQGSMLPLK